MNSNLKGMRGFALVFSLIGLCSVQSAQAGGGGAMTGGATEVTQLLNNTELVASVSEQAKTVAEGIKQTLVQGNQYMAQIRSMLPIDEVKSTLAPFVKTYDDMKKVYQMTTQLMDAANSVKGYLTQNLREAAALEKSPTQFLKWSIEQARTKKGDYATKLQGEVDALNDFQKRAENLQKIQQQIPGIEGQIQGLQALNQTSAIAATEMMGLRALILQHQIGETRKAQDDQIDAGFRLQHVEGQQSLDDSETKTITGLKSGKGWR